jgi:hypothetical protein
MLFECRIVNFSVTIISALLVKVLQLCLLPDLGQRNDVTFINGICATSDYVKDSAFF